MGEVWRANDTRLGREVALKALPAELAHDPERRARFEREARLLAALKHPNVATIYGLEDAGGAPHLVLELVEGESLEQRLTRGPLEPRAAVAILSQVAAGIEAAHERGIVHRDLKPANVMLEPGGGVKVLDFGIAKTDAMSVDATRAGATMPGAVVGTPGYMSPEQARGLEADRRADVWSFGCVLFECLAGAPPFGGDTPSDRIARVLEREPDWRALPSGVPASMRGLLERCLEKDRERRVRDLRDVRLELANVFGGAAKREASLAVLPFAHPPGAEDEYFADGITEEILNALAQVEGLRVAARTSSFSFKGKSEDLRTIATALDVTNMLEGSVRRAGNRLRITARLVQASDGATLWSERYEREMTDVFELQDEIARAIAEKLAVSFGGAARKAAAAGVRNPEAYELFLKGRACVYRRGRYVYDAIVDFERAIELEPDYAEALAWLADAYRNLATFGMEAPHEVMPRARAAAERALAIDPGQFEALSTLADIEAQYDRNYARALTTWQRACDLESGHVRARCERALWGLGFGGLSEDEARAEVRASVEKDPLNSWAIGMWSMLEDVAGNLDASLALGRRAVEADPNSYFAQWSLLRSLAWRADPEEAVAMGRQHFRATGRLVWSFAPMAVAYVRAGRKDAAVALSDELEARARSENVSHVWRAFTAAQAGLEDRALERLRDGASARDPFMLQVSTFRFLEALRGRAEFAEIVAGLEFLGPPRLAQARPIP